MDISEPRPVRLRLATTGTALLVAVAVLAAGAAAAPSAAPATVAVSTSASAPGSTIFIDGTQYPDPLTLGDGTPVTDSATWESQRRPELLQAFQENVYGQSLPQPRHQTFDVSSSTSGDVVRKIVKISITGPEGVGSFDLTVSAPKGRKPLGTFLMIDHRGSASHDGGGSGYAPVSTITGAGYAFASFDAGAIAPDDGRGYRSRMIDVFHPSGEDLPRDGGRAISAWAWGASRAMDYLQTDRDIDPTRVAVIGHSRSGKAALWAGAQDTRFAAVISNDSGSTGAKPARRDTGESVEQVNRSFPYWFPQTYKAFNGRAQELPVDQHELLALVAPRRVVIGSATDDANSDPQGEFLAYVAAAPVYALYGLGDTGLSTKDWKPAVDRAFRGPAMSYHLRSGGHGLTESDWHTYLTGDLFGR